MTSIVALLLALAEPRTVATGEEIFAPTRLDCEVSYTRRFGENFSQSEPDGTSKYTFLIPYKARVGEKAYWIRTLDDGRSWLKQVPIFSLHDEPWPSFAVEFGTQFERTILMPNPSTRGQMSLMGSPTVLLHGRGWIEEKGICQITAASTGGAAG